MAVLQRLAVRYPLAITILFLCMLYGFIFWISPASRSRSSLFLVIPFIITLNQYYQYRKGNRQPLERMAFLSIIVTITLLALTIFTWLFGTL